MAKSALVNPQIQKVSPKMPISVGNLLIGWQIFMNTVFQPGFMQAELDSFIAVYRPELPDHINRWQRPASIADWEASIVPVQKNFITRRQSVFLEHTVGQL